MPSNLTEPEIILRAMLSGGPRCSREVLAEMAARGISAKQARTAREKQRIAMHRTGSGKDMRTTWALLPDVAIHAHADRTRTRTPARVAMNAEPQRMSACPAADDAPRQPAGPEQVLTAADAPDAAADTSESQRQRHVARIHAFVGRGVPLEEAKLTADRLMQADRENRHAYGSCAQCLMWAGGECDRVQPASTLHVCWHRRSSIP